MWILGLKGLTHHPAPANATQTPLVQNTLACSKRSDSGERCGVEKAMKSRGGLGREVRVPSLTSPPPSLLLFRAPFYFAPLPTI